MTLRFFYQRSVKTNSKFGILILVIVLTARLIECDDATEAPAGGEGDATEAEAEEGQGTEKLTVEPIECSELYSAEKSCSDMEEIVHKIGELKGKACIINNDHVDNLCQLIDRCPDLADEVGLIFVHSVMPNESVPHQYVHRYANLTCIGHHHHGADNGKMLSESLWLILMVVGGLMILFTL